MPEYTAARLRRLLACLVVVATVPSAAAAATARSEVVPEDQARAKAMLLKKSDFRPGFVPKSTSGGGSGSLGKLRCPGLESTGIPYTGNAGSPNFTRGPVFVGSHAFVYGTDADAAAFWRDLVSKPGRECLAKIFRRVFEGSGEARLVSFRKTSFPRTAQRSMAFRGVAKVKTIPVYFDLVMLKHERAAVMLSAGGALVPLQRGDLVQFARLLAGRMQTAMRGA